MRLPIVHCGLRIRSGCSRGTTLVELVVVISVQAVLLALGVGLIARLLEADQASREDYQVLSNLDALSEQFRSDVHAATGISPSPDGKPSDIVLALDLPQGRRVAYESTAGKIQRFDRKGDEVLHRETFRLRPEWNVTIQEKSTDSHRLIRLAVTSQAPAGSSRTPAGWAWEAVLGRDHATLLPEGRSTADAQ